MTQSPVATVPAAPRGGAVERVRGRRRPWRAVISAVVALLAVAAVAVFLVRRAKPSTEPRYLTAAVVRGDLVETVRATGTVQPVLQVQVGAQVSGRVVRVAVDYNSRVRAGDLLAELDATPYSAQVAQVRAQLMSARAQLAQNRANQTLAERNLARAQAMRAQGLNAQADVDAAEASRDATRAAVQVSLAQIAQAMASLEVARTNLAYTRILAPIDGIVATRSVDPGQTVAASFQTPTLFLINNDLTQMQVIANVDEANIGRLREGMAAEARVDAFPREAFRGTVRTLRITPITTSGVVTYQAVLAVANPEERLRPGMTATITVVTSRRDAVLRVPNAALRYRPRTAAAATADAGAQTAGAQGPRAGRGANGARTSSTERGAVYALRNGRATRVPVSVGITDGVWTEVTAQDLRDGETVVVDESDAAGVTPTAAPRGPRMF